MKNIILIGKNLDDIRPLCTARGMVEVATDQADLVIAHGGDGTLFDAERLYPALPKLPIRDSRTASHCAEHSYEKTLDAFLNGTLKLSHLPKIAGTDGKKVISGINDLFVHNADRVRALRYRVWIDDVLYADEIVGDGVGLATVHGSTAYYRSITQSIFRVGLGLAFSNSTEEVNHMVIGENSRVRVRIVRGSALLVADNSPDMINISEGGEVELGRTGEEALVWGLSDFMCPRCRLLRHPKKLPFKAYFAD